MKNKFLCVHYWVNCLIPPYSMLIRLTVGHEILQCKKCGKVKIFDESNTPINKLDITS